MDSLRTPFFVIAVLLLLSVVLGELGAAALLPAPDFDAAAFRARMTEESGGRSIDPDAMLADARALSEGGDPPGLAVRALVFMDGMLLLPVMLMTLSLLVPPAIHARAQGVVSLFVSIGVLGLGIAAILQALVLLMVMIALLTSGFPGTIIYFALYGFFDRGGASVALAAILGLKLAFAVCLVLAQQRFLQNKSLMLMILSSLLANLIVAFLHGLVPIFLVSILDAVAAIIVSILGVIWAVLGLVGALIAIVKAIASLRRPALVA